MEHKFGNVSWQTCPGLLFFFQIYLRAHKFIHKTCTYNLKTNNSVSIKRCAPISQHVVSDYNRKQTHIFFAKLEPKKSKVRNHQWNVKELLVFFATNSMHHQRSTWKFLKAIATLNRWLEIKGEERLVFLIYKLTKWKLKSKSEHQKTFSLIEVYQ